MKTTFFEIQEYKRLALRDVNKITMTPEAKLQVILGTNGSGKSAIMAELSPLASNHSNFGENGYKFIKTTHKNSEYECTSDFRGPKNKYSLIKDGIELFSGHSSTVYQNLVKQEFGLTPQIHAIRTGEIVFTRMSTEQRRSWFTSLCPEDYTYAIGYFERLGAATRDISGTIKRINAKLMAEKAKLIDAEEEERIRREIQQAIRIKNEMMQHWRPMESSVEQSLDQIAQIDTKLLEMESTFNSMYRIFSNREGYSSQQEIWDAISVVQGRLTYSQQRINELCESIDTNRLVISKASASANQDIAQLTKDLAEVSREITRTRLGQFVPEWDNVSSQQPLKAYDDVYPELMGLMDQLTEDPELKNTAVLHKEDADALILLGKHIDGAKHAQTRQQDQLTAMEHRRQEGHTKCPKCEHVWFKGFSEDIQKEELKKILELGNAIEVLQAQYDQRHLIQEERAHQLQVLDRIGLLARSNPILETMWRGLSLRNFMRQVPKSAIEYVKATRMQIEISVILAELLVNQASLKADKEAAVQTSGINQQELMDKNTVMEGQLHSLQTSKYNDEQRLASLKADQKAMDYQERYIPLAEDILMRRDNLIQKAEQANHHTAVNSIVMSIDAEISEKERLLSQIDSQKSLIKVLEMEVEDCVVKEKTMKKALEKLSPSKGLIGRGLTGFINHFIAQANAIIEKVWTYPLSIDPVKIKEDGQLVLDYQFSYTYDGNPGGGDVSHASGAQKEIFDLVFKMVSMVHLGLDDSEMFLDEFSIKMDYVHRKEAMKLVMDLITSSNFSQVFMISHYENSYGSMSEADITVLCPENIQIPEGMVYNTRSQLS